MCASIAIASERSSALLRRWQDTRIEKLPRHSRRIPQGNRHTGKLIQWATNETAIEFASFLNDTL